MAAGAVSPVEGGVAAAGNWVAVGAVVAGADVSDDDGNVAAGAVGVVADGAVELGLSLAAGGDVIGVG
jgi:hypothetical protein